MLKKFPDVLYAVIENEGEDARRDSSLAICADQDVGMFAVVNEPVRVGKYLLSEVGTVVAPAHYLKGAP